MPRSKKPFGTAADRRNGQRLMFGAEPLARFDPPQWIGDEARAAWDALWDDRQPMLFTSVTRVILTRWVVALDCYTRLISEADDDPLVRGSVGQYVVNPLYRIAAQHLRTVEACERQLGIGLLNAADLGLATIAEARSIQTLNARYTVPPKRPGLEIVSEENDPRQGA